MKADIIRASGIGYLLWYDTMFATWYLYQSKCWYRYFWYGTLCDIADTIHVPKRCFDTWSFCFDICLIPPHLHQQWFFFYWFLYSKTKKKWTKQRYLLICSKKVTENLSFNKRKVNQRKKKEPAKVSKRLHSSLSDIKSQNNFLKLSVFWCNKADLVEKLHQQPNSKTNAFSEKETTEKLVQAKTRSFFSVIYKNKRLANE